VRRVVAERRAAFDAARGIGVCPGSDRPAAEHLAWRQKDNAKTAAIGS
jgi:hypothetical protein